MQAEPVDSADGSRLHIAPKEQPASGGAHVWWFIAGAVVAGGAILRAFAARGDLSLDEITSLAFAQVARTAGGVFTSIHSDNNHHLTTLWLLLVGPSAPPIAHRLLAVLAGTAMLALVALRPLPLQRLESLAWLVLMAVSWILVHYASEARGYSLAVFFAVAAFIAFGRYLATRRRSWAALFALATTLGLVSHLTFLFALAAFATWGLVDAYQGRQARRLDAMLLAAFAVPAAALAFLWAVDLRYMIIAGGPAWEPWTLVRELLRATLGLPHGPVELLGFLAVTGAAWEVGRMARGRRSEWAFFATLFLAPPLVVAWVRPLFIAPRYFIVTVPFLLLLVAISLARLARRGTWGRATAAAAIAVVVAGSAVHDARLLRYGRGSYRDAIEYIVRNSPPGGATVASDNDFRNTEVLGFYAPTVPGADLLAYVPRSAWGLYAPLWLLQHDFSEDPRPPPDLLGPQGRPYRLVREFPCAGLSGWNWELYRRGDAP